jgi:hypothetical protein
VRAAWLPVPLLLLLFQTRGIAAAAAAAISANQIARSINLSSCCIVELLDVHPSANTSWNSC